MLSLFLIYPGLISIVQFRQFIASSIGVVALILLFAKVQHRYIFFIVLASFACLIHRSAAVLFLLLLWPLLRAFSRKGRTLATIFVICSCLGVISNAETISAFFFGEKRTYVYLSAYQGATAGSRAALFPHVGKSRFKSESDGRLCRHPGRRFLFVNGFHTGRTMAPVVKLTGSTLP